MSELKNIFGQPIGQSMKTWTTRPLPQDITLEGQYCLIEPLNPELHTKSLFQAFSLAENESDWTYLFFGPFTNFENFKEFITTAYQNTDPKYYTIMDRTSGEAIGLISLMRIDPVHGVIEVGNVVFSERLKRKPAATEVQYLLMKYVFESLQYRRYEWKCDNFNLPSKKAAQRLGFQFEGLFRQAIVYKERTRDTAWFSIIDSEWSLLKQAFELWLSPTNFDKAGKQINRLELIRDSL